MVYERVVDGKVTEYVYATAGSVEGRDWAENAKQPLGLSKQYHNAVENAKTLSKALSNTELNFVGHSLGGGEAALNSLVTSNEKAKQVLGWVPNKSLSEILQDAQAELLANH